ncbi:MAG: GerMN domain-containing protein [Candidatus Absconditabacterales bacterium]
MKKILWTTLFWLVVIFLFRSYIRLFDKELSIKIGGRFIPGKQVCNISGSGNNVSSQDETIIKNQLSLIQSQLDSIFQKINNKDQLNGQVLQTNGPTTIKLFYFNQTEDQKLPASQQVNVTSILPIYRIIPQSNDVIKDTINLLIQGDLNKDETAKGFTTEFPNDKFSLLNADLQNDGTLTLEFNDVPGFTDGGSARMLILANSISKTAMQFNQVKKVIFTPETLFQP